MTIPKAHISLSDVDDLIQGASTDDSSRLSSLTEISSHDTSRFDCDYSVSSNVPAPSAALIEKFLSHSSDLYSSAVSIVSDVPVCSRYDINWISLEDYARNWDVLDKDSQVSLRLLAQSDHKSVNRFGLKKRNLESHLLLHVGCDMNNIVNNGRDSVRSNLKSPIADAPNHGYSQVCLYNRTVDAKTCVRAYKKFQKEYSPETLFKKGLVAYQAVITSDNTLRGQERDPALFKERVHSFFKSNTEFLSKLCNKRRKIFSYAYSHEISVDSILDQKYRPHTHVIFFVEKDTSYRAGEASESQHLVQELENSINREFTDRKWSCEKIEIESELFPKVARKYSEIERSFEYLHRAYSLADQYMREIREDNIRSLNKATVETYRKLIWLFSAEEGGAGRRGVRRFRSSHIPREDEKSDYKHPLLSKAGKKSKIKKESVKVKKDAVQPSSETDSSTVTHQPVFYATDQISTTQPGPKQSIPSGRLQKSSRRARTRRALHHRYVGCAVEDLCQKEDRPGRHSRAHPPRISRIGRRWNEAGRGCEKHERRAAEPLRS